MISSKPKFENYCPICGFDWGSSIYEYSEKYGYDWSDLISDSICDICFIHYSYVASSIAETINLDNYRFKWISNGMPFHFPSHKFHLAKTEDPEYTEHLIENCIRLKNIDIDFTKKETVGEYKKDIPNIEEIIKPYLDSLKEDHK